MTRSDALLVRAVGEVARRDLMSGEPSDLPGVGSLQVVHRPSRQVYDGRRTTVTAPLSFVEMKPDLGGISDSVLPRASVAVNRNLDEVRSSWLGIIDRAIAGEPVPVAGLGTLWFESGVPAFETDGVVQKAVNARYVGYSDLELSADGDHIEAVTVDSTEEQPVYPLWNTQSALEPSAPPPAAEAHVEEHVEEHVEDHVEEPVAAVDVPPDDWPEHALSVELPGAAVEPASAVEPVSADEAVSAVVPVSADEPGPTVAGAAAVRVDRRTAASTSRGFSVPSALAVVVLVAAVVFGLWYFLVRGDAAPPVVDVPPSTREVPATQAPIVQQGGEATPGAAEGLAEPVWTRGAIDVAAGGFTIIVTSKESEDEAVAFARDFAFDVFPVDILDAVVDGRPWFRVGVGQFGSFALASRALAQHSDSLPAGSWVGQIEQP